MSDPSGGHAAQQYLPENLRALCEERNISQAALAEAMRERNWPWHQQTVYKVMNGKRGISFGEATDLARILGVSTDRLTWSGPEANETAMVDRSIVMLRRSWEEAAVAVRDLLAAIAWGERTIEQHAGSGYERVHEARAELEAELEERTLDTAVDEGAYRYEHRGDED